MEENEDEEMEWVDTQVTTSFHNILYETEAHYVLFVYLYYIAINIAQAL